ncbi:glucans biosynthesis glucosyltransferase MdoH [Methylophaga sp. OBS4]|uniref:glucans biosynthesis glucosyltransferase MdoH n=1 Tax=Methylophaga sp. OBS4 TaxID=2991935 RepID=UPI0022532BF7|nr:glucans biosynthesis glucosyltransferase MdoH [Methylophaga sp. OBS4]MCX4188515.1 glucans biosynthesis glucosyltransferase MdoH [Methylophaga sp. OBS4]
MMLAERALPLAAPLEMPRHSVNEAGHTLRQHKRSRLYPLATLLSRLFIVAVTISLSYYGLREMYGVLSTNSVASLQWLFLALFSINFIWISFAFSQAFLGFLLSLTPRLMRIPEQKGDAPFRTAILLPVYKEEPARIAAAVKTMREDLLRHAPGKYAFFILSDTNEANAWITEENALLELFNNDQAGCPVFYRRRANNQERKAGNIADWVKNWGGAYEAMIVLDADSVMSAESMLTLSRRLAAAPEIGLIQTLPTIVRARSLYGRLQQFANHCFGPIYAKGLSAWHGLSSNFWGHNAIIRTRAFAEACSLPILPGKPPFGGHILSHDFIEAALLRRAGWGLRFDTDIKCSYEEAPPSLTDVLVRDRRWCQGNLQHSRVILAHGLVLPTRLHILSGIMSYLSAVFWLALIVVGLAIAVQALLVRPEYFANPSLFPTWPVFDAKRALSLFIVSMAVVLAPKLFGWFAAIINLRRCRHFGGPILLTLSTLFEAILSALYAPILMVAQFGVVCKIIMGKDSGWHPQSRNDGELNWSQAYRAHHGHTLFGILLAAIAYSNSLALFYWLLPITGGLMLSIPLSWLSGGTKRSFAFTRLGLLRAPEEKYPNDILVKLDEVIKTMPPQDPVQAPLQFLNSHQALCKWHLAQLPLLDAHKPGEFHAPSVTADWKIQQAASLEQLQAWLEPAELLALLSQDSHIKKMKSNGLVKS